MDPQELRLKLINTRKEALAKRMPQQPRVRVVPRDDDVRAFIKHPSGSPFPETGSAEWPLDTFTQRRLADGDVTLEEGHEPHKPARHTSHS
jgi:hypothetical protein